MMAIFAQQYELTRFPFVLLPLATQSLFPSSSYRSSNTISWDLERDGDPVDFGTSLPTSDADEQHACYDHRYHMGHLENNTKLKKHHNNHPFLPWLYRSRDEPVVRMQTMTIGFPLVLLKFYHPDCAAPRPCDEGDDGGGCFLGRDERGA